MLNVDLLLITGLIIIVAATIQSSTGFGFSIVGMILLPLMLPVIDSMILITVVNFVAITSISFKYRKYIKWKQLWLPVSLSLLGNYIGLRQITSINNDLAVKVIGIALIGLSIYLLFLANKVKMNANWINSGICGSLSGLMGGFFSIPGPPIVLYYSASTESKESYIGTLQCFFLINGLFKLGFFITNVQIEKSMWEMIPFLMLAAGIGTFVGNWLFRKVSDVMLKRMVYGFMIVAGVYYVIK